MKFLTTTAALFTTLIAFTAYTRATTVALQTEDVQEISDWRTNFLQRGSRSSKNKMDNGEPLYGDFSEELSEQLSSSTATSEMEVSPVRGGMNISTTIKVIILVSALVVLIALGVFSVQAGYISTPSFNYTMPSMLKFNYSMPSMPTFNYSMPSMPDLSGLNPIPTIKEYLAGQPINTTALNTTALNTTALNTTALNTTALEIIPPKIAPVPTTPVPTIVPETTPASAGPTIKTFQQVLNELSMSYPDQAPKETVLPAQLLTVVDNQLPTEKLYNSTMFDSSTVFGPINKH